MGRRPDTPELQAAKGFPGKRRSRVERQAERAAEIAALLASAPGETADPLSPPALLHHPMCAAALAVWREYVPRLVRYNLLVPLDRHTFAMFCVYTAEFAEAHQDVVKRGYSSPVKTVSGDKMDRVNPSVDRRDNAQKIILDMAKRFGLTPLDRFSLIGHQAAARGGLFDQQAKPTTAPTADQTEVEPDGLLGLMDSFDSAPPGSLQ
ncbi:P27 family phage terminase small subunit [Lichenihabitans psoromatis]|uniref:P27 family phage terminase small subunit n=1 Tax=Lichenihabitans psoromatis TaxID=2528642 RepID=UPI0010383FA8|nr:P27 family phage terminase small subunit [Lichenihabitans psoromatis]